MSLLRGMMQNKIIPLYSKITKYCKINNLGPPFAYFEADSINSHVYTTNLIELDVSAAFPNICRFYFGKDHPFVKKIFSIENKRKRNIFISITLTEQSKIDKKNYLQELNLWCKILILGYTYALYDDVNILEYKKDGLLFKGNQKINLTDEGSEFLSFLENGKIQFHNTLILQYARFHQTSLYDINKKLTVKGYYKDFPKYFKQQVIKLFINGRIYDNELLYNIKEKYSYVYSQILIKSNLNELFNDTYAFIKNSEPRYITISGKLVKNKSILNAKTYLTYIIYPLLSLLKLKVKQI